MTAQELRAQTDEQLKGRLLELKREQFNLRFQKATGQLENTRRIREVRREIARVLTVLNERRRARAAAQAKR
ncbi:MAG: 50S ribosomal protein L29 [Geminicoccaceae bacterium]|nr:50S ribosomal protein L29 [Geminicoccaceae bacterium]MCS7267213.1 50S ribosomal protein L29 [Geminicoccaceae bacterium]MCX7629772.1 50S ribosomal protein L29 [Geminicoccaceae bacterium]MDW8124007.1 50S ribosomal protein L29 [Geminicoccaceae bacterium]MDW8340700.1 50S ribosomal protein L29 [Geminicoccaceae bacterium]